MDNIKKQYKKKNCPVIHNEVNVEFHFALIENEIIGPPHMRGCDSKNKCEVVDRQPNGIEYYKWVNCPIYQEFS